LIFQLFSPSLHIRFVQYSGMASMNFVDLSPSKGELLPYLRGAEISLGHKDDKSSGINFGNIVFRA